MVDTTKQDTEPDPFDDASSAFIRGEDLVGRLVLVKPTGSGERASTMPGQNGKQYTFIESDTYVLDGEPTDQLPEIPATLDGFQWSGSAVTISLKPKIRTGRFVLGRVGTKPSQTKGFKDALVLDAPTDEDKVLARAFLADLAARTPDPFEG